VFQSGKFRSKKTRASTLVILVPSLLVLRTLIDGNSRVFFGLKLTEMFGLLLFIFSLAFILKFSIKGYPAFLLIPSVLLLSSIQGFYNWGEESLQEASRTLGILGLVLLTWRDVPGDNIDRFFKALKLISVANGILIICQFSFLGGGVFVSNVNKFSGFMTSANTAALLFGCYLISEANKLHSRSRFPRFLAIQISFFGLFLTYSFGGFIFLIVGIYLTILVSKQNRFQNFLKFFLVLIIGVLIAFANSSGLRGKYFSVLAPIFSNTADSRSSVQWRFDAWKSFIPFFTESPIFGQGYGSTQNLNMAGRFLPHNELIRLLVEVGLLGTAILIIMYFVLIFRLRKIWRATGSPVSRYAMVLTITWAVSALSENSFTYTVPQYVLALSIGFSLSIGYRSDLHSYGSPYTQSNRLQARESWD